jgi:hypothetical protein
MKKSNADVARENLFKDEEKLKSVCSYLFGDDFKNQSNEKQEGQFDTFADLINYADIPSKKSVRAAHPMIETNIVEKVSLHFSCRTNHLSSYKKRT